MRKNYILDTNVLLHDPGSLFSFQDNRVIVPIQVVEEIDHFKRQASELGRSARTVSKALDRLRIAAQSTENTMPHILDAVRAYATLQEIMDIFREVFGLYREPTIL